MCKLSKLYSIFFIFSFLANTSLIAQVYLSAQSINGIINTYTKVSAASGTSITVASSAGFSAGNKAVIIQMQGATINPITYTSAFGSITNINDAGNYEVVKIASVAGTTINLSTVLAKSYAPSGNVQLITLPQYNGGATVIGTITAPAWNGSTGGVVALESCGVGAAGTITLNADIDVSNKGFRPGLFNPGGGLCYDDFYAYNDGATVSDTVWNTGDVYITGSTATSASPGWNLVKGSAWRAPGNPGCGCYVTVASCNNASVFDSATYTIAKNIVCTGRTGYYLNSYIVNGGEKGEGIALPIATLKYGRGAIANGGGGGNEHNGGGGGGANYGAGGFGGMDLSTCFANLPANQKDTAARGVGGYSLSAYYSQNKIFMGGGGGSPHENDLQNTVGTPGGGIIILTANMLVNSGSFKIIASALDNNLVSNSGNPLGADADGAGGAGGGGTVLMNVNTFTNAITVEAKGGRGGNNVYDDDPSQCYAPGGGGGGGAVWFKTSTLPVGITVNVANGNAGNEYLGGVPSARACNNNDPRYGARAGNNGGTLFGLNLSSTCVTLPVSWISLNARPVDNTILVEWSSASEKNNQYFTIEKSTDGTHWTILHIIPSGLSPSSVQHYAVLDNHPELNTINYYRIKQTDVDGNSSYSSVFSAKLWTEETFKIFPNPIKTGDKAFTIFSSSLKEATVRIMDVTGKIVLTENILIESGPKGSLLSCQNLSQGVYLVYIQTNQQVSVLKLVVE